MGGGKVSFLQILQHTLVFKILDEGLCGGIQWTNIRVHQGVNSVGRSWRLEGSLHRVMQGLREL
jgi:uncharacterized protein (DUF2252 family)